MNFKSPRDPNTKSPFQPLRTLLPSEAVLCQCGSGECTEIAIEIQGDGSGKEFALCGKHSKEFHALGKLIAEMFSASNSEISRSDNQS